MYVVENIKYLKISQKFPQTQRIQAKLPIFYRNESFEEINVGASAKNPLIFR